MLGIFAILQKILLIKKVYNIFKPKKEFKMNETKSWYASKAVWGGLIAMAAGILPLVGITLDANAQATLVSSAVSIATVLGSLLALYGRFKADKPLGK